MNAADVLHRCTECGFAACDADDVVCRACGAPLSITQPSCQVPERGSEKRLDAIENRLGELARAIDTVALGYADHMNAEHDIKVNLTLLAVPGYETSCPPPPSG